MNKFIGAVLFLFLFCALVVHSGFAQSGVYKYQDASGNAHYVDDPSKIPEQYRKGELQPHSLPSIIRDKSRSAVQHSEPSVHEIPQEVKDSFDQLVKDVPTINPPSEDSSITYDEKDDAVKISREEMIRFLKPIIITVLIVILITLISLGILLQRGGQSGFGIIIPIYNLVLLSRLGGYSGWWILWFCLPGLGGIIWSWSVYYSIAKNFGRGDLFAIGAALFPFPFFPIMVFSD